MSMTQIQQQNVPPLRFPEFSGEWDSLKLGDIAAFSKGKGISKADIDADGVFECIRYGQLYTDYFETIEDIKSRTSIPANELVFSDANDIIIPASGETQIDIATASCVLKGGVALGGDLNIVKTEHDGVFLSYYLNSTRKYDIARLSQGISVVHLYATQLKTLHLNLPEGTEQQKIASFLSSVDGKIEQLGKKKALLEQYKKGMMQKLFSQELRFKPSINPKSGNRFSDQLMEQEKAQGNDFPDWEEKRLGDVCKLQGGYAFKSSEFKKSGIPIIRISNISNHNNYIQKRGMVFYDKIGNAENFVINYGDLLLAMSGATTGKSSIYNLPYPAYLNQRVGIFRAQKKLVQGFLTQFVFSNLFYQQLDAVLVAGAQPNISSKDIESFRLNLPTGPEQQKIADFLSSIDQKIDLVSTELDHAKTFKKGLLQQMFI